MGRVEDIRRAYDRGYRDGQHAVRRFAACRTCHGAGSIPGFLLHTRKKCPACDGRGSRG